MSDYIKREDAIKAMCSMCPTNKFIYGTCQYLLNGECAEINDLKTIPSADVVERSEHEEKVNEIIFAHKDWKPIKRGEWVLDPNGMDWNIPAWRCSRCGFVANYIGVEANGFGSNPMNWAGSNFCPNCGADMREREEE